jgi:hypothetical protein
MGDYLTTENAEVAEKARRSGVNFHQDSVFSVVRFLV